MTHDPYYPDDVTGPPSYDPEDEKMCQPTDDWDDDWDDDFDEEDEDDCPACGMPAEDCVCPLADSDED